MINKKYLKEELKMVFKMKGLLNLKYFKCLGIIAVSMFCGLAMLVAGNKKGETVNNKLEIAYFAGGCFWCMEDAFDKVEGIEDVISGYMGGHTENPSYEDVSYKNTGHAEAIKVAYDPKKITYSSLLKIFWINVDATDGGGQFCDRGLQYRTAIFFQNDAEKKAIDESIKRWQSKLNVEGKIVTEISLAKKFYPAEEYHQDYHIKNPLRYKYYKYSCGREKRLKEVWGRYYQKDNR